MMWEPNQRYPDPAVQVLDPSFNKYRLPLASVERLYTGCRWSEGPVYFGDGRPVPFATRHLYRSVLDQLGARGYDFVAGLEVEFHLFKLEDARLSPEDAGQPGSSPPPRRSACTVPSEVPKTSSLRLSPSRSASAGDEAPSLGSCFGQPAIRSESRCR